MADYIYLLQNRLTPAQRRALQAVREAARVGNVTVFLVGGAVRDLSSGAPVRDLDFAVQGEASGVVEALQAGGAALAGRNDVLGASYLTLAGGVRVEVGPTLSVSFPKPGRPKTEPATILDDLRRRDFTANAMAISLNEGSYGLLLDPLNGIADIENRELRLVSNYGFIEQPALLLRAARLSARLGWALEERTASRYETAKEERYIAGLGPGDRGYELEEIFHEEDPLAALEQMEAEGWSDTLIPSLLASKSDRNGMDAVRDLVGQMEALGIHPDPSVVFFPLLTGKLAPAEVETLKGQFARPGFVEQIETAEARAKELAAQLTSKAAALPSESWKLLFAAEPDVVLWLAFHSRSSAVQSKLKAFLKEWPPMRQRIPYALMQEMRITPDLPGYDKLQDDLFFALIDGKLDTPEATRVFLEPYSPPAPPPQVNVRRRPAKSARGRAKKAVAVAADAEDDEEESSAGTPPDTSEATPSGEEDQPGVTATPDTGVGVAEEEIPPSDVKALPIGAIAAPVQPAPARKQAPPAAKRKVEAPRESKDAVKTAAKKIAPAKAAPVSPAPKKAAVPPAPAKKSTVPAAKKAVSKPVQAGAKHVAKSVGAAPAKASKSAVKTSPKKAAVRTSEPAVPRAGGGPKKPAPTKAKPGKPLPRKAVVKQPAVKPIAKKAAIPAKRKAAKVPAKASAKAKSPRR